jgi:hypothetical protein
MKARHLFALVALALTAGMVACEDDDGTGPDEDLAFTATMNGANEKPNAVTTTGAGTATFELNDAETSAEWTITIPSATPLTSNITNAHIHLGNANVSGGVIVLLPPSPTTSFPILATSSMWSGTITSSTSLLLGLSWSSLIDLIRNGDAYVNVHSANFPSGEIRGQLVPVP